jgi:mRNA-degrading endonuclease toxin of MazEF toxin-antitoxin module
MVDIYIPDRGDIVKLDFALSMGRAQTGYRPALIVTNMLGSLLASVFAG